MKTLLMISTLTLTTTHLAEAKYPAGTQLLCTGANGTYLDLFVQDQIGGQDIIGGTKQNGVLNFSAPGLQVENEVVVLENSVTSTRCGQESFTYVKFSGGLFGVTKVKNNACGQQHYINYFVNVSESGAEKQISLDCQVGVQ